MTKKELLDLVELVEKERSESSTLELKAAKGGTPSRLYDTLSSFSNQDEGGIILFGIDEENGFDVCGVYDAHDLQKKVREQCMQMQPPVRPLISIAEKDGKKIVAAEIPGIDLSERPCYYRGVGINKGSYIRVGDSDEPMTAYEIYSYEAYRKKYQDDIRTVQRASLLSLDQERLDQYIEKLKEGKKNFRLLRTEQIYELMGITRDNDVTLSAVLLFSPYPQAYFPQLCITAVVVPGTEIGEEGADGERFSDNARIEGSIPEMLTEAIEFIRRNTRRKTIIDPLSGKRADRPEYPTVAVREAILNALVHRDYSMHTEGMPIQILIYNDRLEIRNPGGIYGRITIDQLGKAQPDTRNPVLASALEAMGITENRYSGIPTIRRALQEYGLEAPEFKIERNNFVVRFYRHNEDLQIDDTMDQILAYCSTPRTRKEIAQHLDISTEWYVDKKYLKPLVEAQRLLTDDSEGKRKRKYYTK